MVYSGVLVIPMNLILPLEGGSTVQNAHSGEVTRLRARGTSAVEPFMEFIVQGIGACFSIPDDVTQRHKSRSTERRTAVSINTAVGATLLLQAPVQFLVHIGQKDTRHIFIIHVRELDEK